MSEQLIKDCMKLGFGLMRLPRLEGGKEIDIEQTKVMVDKFLEAGGKYFDTAFVYEGSEEATNKSLCSRHKREEYYLASKLNAGEFCCKSKEEARNEIKVSLERTGAGYFDFYLLHALGTGNLSKYDEYGLWDYVKELKKDGLIKHYGFSFHDKAEVLDKILTDHPDAEFVQLQINYADWNDPSIQSRKCLEVAIKHGKQVVVMEPVKGGTLANPPEGVKKILKEANPSVSLASWAVRFAASQENVMVVLSGMSNVEQLEDNLSYMKDFKPLGENEAETVKKAEKAFRESKRIGCTACRYCTPGCPVEMQIPDHFAAINDYWTNTDMDKNDFTWRVSGPKASECIECGQCEDACPQHLPIIKLLKEVARTFE